VYGTPGVAVELARMVSLRRVRKALGGTGRVLITVGLLLLLFVAYQLWGTGIYEARAQDQLRSQLDRTLQSSGATTTTATTAPGPSTATTAPRTVALNPTKGDALALIDIPKIGINKVVVEGVDVDDLRKAPGHYPSTSLPGQEGDTAIAGHRTTYGAPFGDLDQLAAGDEITVVTVQGKFHYRVTQQRVVDPSDVSVLDPTPDPAHPGHNLATLTLTTCNPKYSAAQRLVVQAALELPPTQELPLPPSPTTPGQKSTVINGLSGEQSSRSPTILWGFIAAAIGLLWWLGFHRYPRWTTWLVGSVPFLVTLFVCYMHLERLLPSNY
jgi:sortase A